MYYISKNTIVRHLSAYVRETFLQGVGYKKLLLHSAFALTLTSGLSYILGFMRDRVLAQTFGISSTLDVYYAAFVVPDIILAIFVTSCVSAALIPLFAQNLKIGDDHARQYLYNILFIITGMTIVTAIAAAIAIPYLAPYLVEGFDDAQRELYVTTVRIMLLSPILFAVSNILGGVLLSLRDFFFYGIAPVFYNLGIIVGVVFFVPTYGMMGLVWGTIFGAFLHLMSRAGIAIIRIGAPTRRALSWNAMTTKTFFLMIPKIFQIGAWQMLLGWFIFLASRMEEGSVTVYSFARNFQSMPVSLIGIALALSAFATLSHLAAQGRIEKFRRVLRHNLYVIAGMTIAASIVLALISHPLIALLFGGKAFDATAVSLTAMLLSVYAITIPFESVMHLLVRAHYALQSTLRPSLIHIFAIFVTIALGWYGKEYGVVIIPLSFAVGLIIQNILLALSYRIIINKIS